MRTTLVTVLCLLVASALTEAKRSRRSADLQLVVSPDDVMETETPEVQISCQPPASLSDVYQAFLIFLDHKDSDEGDVTPVVQQTPGGTVVMVTGNITDRLIAEGSMGSGEPSFLSVTLANPQASDSGIYSCRFIYMDSSYALQRMSAEVVLDVQQPNVTEVVEIIPVPEVVVPVEVEVVEEVCNCSTIREEIDELRDTLLIENAELKARLEERPVLAPVVAGAVDASCQASFTARLSVRGIPLVDGSTIPFNVAVSNKNDAFNTGSGVFTAPCDGQYYFSLTMRSYQYMNSGSVEAAIMVDDVSQVRTSVFVRDDRIHYESAGVTAVLSLTSGQQVKVMLKTTSSGQLVGEEYSSFSGFYLF